MRRKLVAIAIGTLLTLGLAACDETIDKSKETLGIDEETTTEKEREAEKEENESKQEEVSQEEWEDYRNKMLEHYEDANILDIQAKENMDYEVFNVIVPNEFKMNSEEEKQYYVEEIGPMIQEDLQAHFNTDIEKFIIYFDYQDGNTMARTEAFGGGWKLK